MNGIAVAVRHLYAAGVQGEALSNAIADMEDAYMRATGELPAFSWLVEAYRTAPIQMKPVKPVKRDTNKERRGIAWKAWDKLRKQTFERDGWECVYCGSGDDLTCDHVVPLARGGTNENQNLATACRSCNSSKGDKLISEWRASCH